MEAITDTNNLQRALKRVCSNGGSPGVDGKTVDDLKAHAAELEPTLREQLLCGSYRPMAVLRRSIEKSGGGTRDLGIPTVIDRWIQQAILQVLEPIFDPHFSNSSYGFRRGRSAKQAVEQAKVHIQEGRVWVVDIDLERFFDRVNHDVLMSRVSRRVGDRRVLALIGAYLRAGVMVNGIVMDREEGTPQGGPLSPLLANILLDDLDKELEKRGHRFCRYADDCNIFTRTEAAGKRVMTSVREYLERRLHLKVNEAKSAVDLATKRKFLGFTFEIRKGIVRIRIARKSLERAHDRLRELTGRTRALPQNALIRELNQYLRGWLGYFSMAETPTPFRELGSWLRRRMRQWYWCRWKTPGARRRQLWRIGMRDKERLRMLSYARARPWHMSWVLNDILPNDWLHRQGLLDLLTTYQDLRRGR